MPAPVRNIRNTPKIRTVGFIVATLWCAAATAQTITVTSPDGRNALSLIHI